MWAPACAKAHGDSCARTHTSQTPQSPDSPYTGTYAPFPACQREIAHAVGSGIVFPHLIARGREKVRSTLYSGCSLLIFFYKRAPLLKLTERGGMHPYITVGRGYGGVKTLPYLLLSFVKFFRFRIAHCRNLHSKPVGRYACGIERLLQQPAGASARKPLTSFSVGTLISQAPEFLLRLCGCGL